MKKFFLLTLSVGLSMAAFAQLNLPQPSPKATVSQTFGITEIGLVYSSPAVNGRTIWGGLVPYGQVWRAGANAATEISFSTDVMVGGQAVKAGKYALFMLPGEQEWTVIINSNANQWGSTAYKKELDVARFTVKAESLPNVRERLTYYINYQSNEAAEVVMKWEKVKIAFPVTAKTGELAMASLNKYFRNNSGEWMNYASAARYLIENKGSAADALQFANKAVELNSKHFFGHYIKALALEANNNAAEALAAANEAKRIGEAEPSGFYDVYKADIAAKIELWSKAKPAKKKK